MISNTDIRKALRAKLESIAGLPEKNQWQGRTFTPEQGTAYMRETLIPNNEVLTANNEVTALGIYQIDYITPFNSLLSESEGKAEAIKQAFHPPQELMSGLMQIYQAEVLQGSEEGPVYRVPVRIYYRVFSTINP